MPSRQDYSLIKSTVQKSMTIYGLDSEVDAFYYVVLGLILNLQDDEIEDSITDSSYIGKTSEARGHDRGIDAIFIDDASTPPIVHLATFKYTSSFDKISGHFPSSEIDKIMSFLHDLLLEQDTTAFSNANIVLKEKVADIHILMEQESPQFKIHICSNIYNGFEPSEEARFKRKLGTFADITFQYHLLEELVRLTSSKSKNAVNAKIRAIDKRFFEKSSGDIRALIFDAPALDLLRIICDDEEIRNNPQTQEYTTLVGREILEDAFDDNVRIYLTQRSKINKDIKETAIGDKHHRFFYYNNGITITCDKFSYPSYRSPIIELENLQVVNGSQTLHALFEAFREHPEAIEEIEILCRIYETTNKELSSEIAESTNCQNPVKSRDIRSNDYSQKKIESELLALGFFYERKKNQHKDKEKRKRIDAEKAGQALMAFYNKLPAEAKDKKRLIFSDKYDDVFNDDITAHEVIIAHTLYCNIENCKNRWKKDNNKTEEDSFIMHSSYYLLTLLRILADNDNINIHDKDSIDAIFSLYSTAYNFIKQAVEKERTRLIDKPEAYSNRHFFKGKRPKIILDSLLPEGCDF